MQPPYQTSGNSHTYGEYTSDPPSRENAYYMHLFAGRIVFRSTMGEGAECLPSTFVL